VWKKLGFFYPRRGHTPPALATLRRADAGVPPRGPGQTALWIGRLELALADRTGDAAAQRQHLAAAVPQLRRALEYGYHPWEANTYLATAHQRLGQPDEALAASTAAVRSRPRDPVVVFSALRVRAALGRCDEARALREDLRRLRDDPQADQILASCAAG
jgi:tetratricopeptide (TPR) repeat protein